MTDSLREQVQSLRRLLEGDVIDLSKAKSLRKIRELVKEIPSVFKKQHEVEFVVAQAIKALAKTAEARKFRFSVIAREFQDDTHPVAMLHLIVAVPEDSPPVAVEFARKVLREKKTEILALITKELDLLNDLEVYAKEAIASQYPRQTIAYARTERERWKAAVSQTSEVTEANVDITVHEIGSGGGSASDPGFYKYRVYWPDGRFNEFHVYAPAARKLKAAFKKSRSMGKWAQAIKSNAFYASETESKPVAKESKTLRELVRSLRTSAY